MGNKLWMIGVLLVCMVGLSGSNADAGYPASIGGWGAWPGSITVWSYWKGITNSDRRPTEVVVSIDNLVVIGHYINPGGNGGGDGTPFYPNISLAEKETFNTAYADQNGWYYSEITFDDIEIINAIDPDTIPPPPNPQWTFDTSNIKVSKFKVRISGWSDTNSDLQADKLTTYADGECVLDSGGASYTCTELGSWYVRLKK